MTKKTIAQEGSPPSPHPGKVLADILERRKISASDLADRIGVSRSTIHRLLTEKTAVTPKMSVQLGQELNFTPNFFLAIQMNCEVAQALAELKKNRRKIVPADTDVYEAELEEYSEKIRAFAKKVAQIQILLEVDKALGEKK
jgi:addiction module HigA family antidote